MEHLSTCTQPVLQRTTGFTVDLARDFNCLPRKFPEVVPASLLTLVAFMNGKTK